MLITVSVDPNASIENMHSVQATEGAHKDALEEEPRPAASSSFISSLTDVSPKSEGKDCSEALKNLETDQYIWSGDFNTRSRRLESQHE